MSENKKQTKEISDLLAGQRVTVHRLLLLGLLQKEGHLNAEELYSRAKEKEHHISLSTVYRNLQLFLKMGLIEEHYFGMASPCYEVKAELAHHHMKCLHCGKITDLEYSLSQKMKEEIEKRKGFHITGARMLLVGYCADCLKYEDNTA
jgi:Fe2+ or Zn2+ uptake regulation protein